MQPVGVLAYQGGFQKHLDLLKRLNVAAIQVRDVDSAMSVRALVIPGGESTTIGMLMERFGVLDVVRNRIVNEKMPVFGTCAGAILLAEEIVAIDQPHLGVMAITVERNAYGRQIESFETTLSPGILGGNELSAVFIRAPIIKSVRDGTEVLIEFEGNPVLVRQGHLLAATFHPELTDDSRIHEYFLKEVVAAGR